MRRIARSYEAVLRHHIDAHRQMAFVSGPRQVGKTTSCRRVADRCLYLDWDDQDDRRIIVRGPRAVVAETGIEKLTLESPVLVLDELHKYRRWRTFLKGLFDRYADQLRFIVTGSSRMDLYRRGGEQLDGDDSSLTGCTRSRSVSCCGRRCPGARSKHPPPSLRRR